MTLIEIANSNYVIKPTVKPYIEAICKAVGINRQPTIYEALRGDNFGNAKYFDIRLWTLKNLPCEVIKETKIKIDY
jgi:hypothetical protein